MIEHSNVRVARARMALLAVLSISSVTPALAYVDPGTGSMLVQMGLAAIAGTLFYFRQFRMAASAWFRRAVLRQPAEEPVAESKPSASELSG